MARVLYLTQVLPYPLDSGAKVRQYHMIRHLSRQHEVTLVSFTRPDDPPEAVDRLKAICQEVHVVPMRRTLWRNLVATAKGLVTGLPVLVTRDEIGQMKALLSELTRQTRFDVVHADQLSMAGYGLLAARMSPPPPSQGTARRTQCVSSPGATDGGYRNAEAATDRHGARGPGLCPL